MDSDFTTTVPGPVAGSPPAPPSSLSVAEPAGNKQRMYIYTLLLFSRPILVAMHQLQACGRPYHAILLFLVLDCFLLRWQCVASLLAESELQARVSGGWGEVMDCITSVCARSLLLYDEVADECRTAVRPHHDSPFFRTIAFYVVE